jgi:ubiquinone/menaquinone biosynthesis C-methylase UbiE
MAEAAYIHGTHPDEQQRLAKLGELTDSAFLKFVEVPSQSRVLDIGSGLGNFANLVATAVPGSQVIGIERSEEQLTQARRHLRENLRFEQGDAHRLPFDEGTFDVAYCRYLLEHVSSPLQVLNEMLRVLKPGGTAYVQENNILIHVTDPDCPAFEHLWRQFASLQRQIGGDGEIGKRLFGLMRQAGFAEIMPSIQPEIHAHGMSGFEPWIKNLVHIARDATAQMIARNLVTTDEATAGVAQFEALLGNPSACVYFYWNRVRGKKADRTTPQPDCRE